MAIAALYDIHGNIDALDAVLEEIKSQDIDQIVIGGDIAWGPFPAQVIARLRELDALWLRGNTDRDIAQAADDGDVHDDPIKEMDRWCARQLTHEERDFLRDLPATVVLPTDDLGETVFCHGTPRSEDEIVTAATPDEEIARMLDQVPQKVIVCGHTHSQFDRTIGSRRLVNAGSVGLPYEDAPGARWAILGTGAHFKSTAYDLDAAADRVLATDCPAGRWFAESITSPTPRAEAIRTFEERRAAAQDHRE